MTLTVATYAAGMSERLRTVELMAELINADKHVADKNEG